MSAQKAPIKASTQKFLQLKAIEDDLVILKNNGCCLIIQTTSINFGLLSEKEQEATIFAYAHFLNSLAFQIQICIHSRQKDISSYLELINQQLNKQQNNKLKERTKNYHQFIKNIVKQNKILDKDFFIIITYAGLELKKTSNQALLEKAKLNLYPKRDHLIEQLQRIGLHGRQLTNKELVELFYNLYNPEGSGLRFAVPQQYTSTLVESTKQIKPSAPATAPGPIPASGFKPISIAEPQPRSAQPRPEKKEPPSPAALGEMTAAKSKFNILVPSLEKKQQQVLEGQNLQQKLKDIVSKTKDKQP
jgi:hypothetical protein